MWDGDGTFDTTSGKEQGWWCSRGCRVRGRVKRRRDREGRAQILRVWGQCASPPCTATGRRGQRQPRPHPFLPVFNHFYPFSTPLFSAPWGTREGRSDVAILPTRGPPRRQGLCGQMALVQQVGDWALEGLKCQVDVAVRNELPP